MPQKGMRSLCFSPTRSSSPSTSQVSHISSPSRFSFSPSSSRSFADEVMDKTLERAEPMFMKWNPDSTTFSKVTSLFYHSKNEAKDFIKCVNNLQKAMRFLASENPSSEKLASAQNLMQIAMKRLQKELYQILSMNRAHLDPESVSTRSSRSSALSNFSDSDFEENQESEIVEVEDVSTIAMSDLRTIAECMITSGYAKECLKVYKIIRKSIIDEGIYKLGVEKISPSHMNKMDYEVLELKIKNWLNAVRVAVKTLFNGERILCDNVFASNESIKDSIFSEISGEGGVILFSFPENVVKNTKKSKKSPEKVFRVLDMYSSMANLWPEIESIFALQSNSSVKSQAISTLIKMGQFVRESLSDFEAGILKNTSKSIVAGGGIHPLTIEVINYLTLLGDYSTILTDILADMAPPVRSSLPELLFGNSDSIEMYPEDTRVSGISTRLAWLVLVLLCKLDSKAKSYKDISLSYLFLANNLQYIIVKVNMSNLKNLLGDEWLTNHEKKVKQFASTYVKLAWGHVISLIPEDPTAVKNVGVVKDCFKKFNAQFEEVYHKQSVCVVADTKLRDEIKLAIARKLIPVYREFYNKHKLVLSKERNLGSLVRFSPEEIGNYLSDLFFVVVGTESYASSSSSPSFSRSGIYIRGSSH
ncbi:membrane traffic protein [Lithospermum erythrorhizon]|uniref:Exocyst subunit Exo70 family protein n=1 Tax=Lithospermum erythrorhizon TaxID=34254 RepID=A0AAV3PNZ4_LITER